jgi:alkanesulfonate monooxygenase SsuD/methylene tetrahydromethanopterin reductase-like flavin-dependent oxidoreductase (luciferase family)
MIDDADWGAVDGMLALKDITASSVPFDECAKKRHYFAGNAIGGYPYVGTPDCLAEELANVSKAGMRGIAISFVNYLNELPYFCDEVLPRLSRLGVREAMP